ncbi:MAG TPA: biopolymer transporter ExbD, partial [Pseudomonadales bacterium]|nr:biopolymer transporter ExbD [Pseudomonadales bacterium]
MRTRRHDVDEAEVYIDMTPMLDFVLNMLIFFIVTTTFVKATGVTVNIPNAQSASSEQSANIFVAITAKGEIWIDKREVDLHSVRAIMARMHAENPEGAAIVQSDSNANT